jgi:hypothetical protein
MKGLKSMSFQDLVKAVANTPIQFPNLKAVMLAQSIMESGREETLLARLHNNHHGLKYRPEMDGFATAIEYYTDSEPSGHDIFCEFASKEDEVKGYWHFMSRSPYEGWEAHTATARDYLNFIAPTYCPPGYKPEWAEKHGGLNYTEYIVQKLLPEAEKLLAEYKEEEPNMELKKVTWFEFNRSDEGKPFVTAYNESQAVYTHKLSTAKDFYEWVRALNAERSSVLVAETEKKAIPKCPDIYETPPVEPPKPPTDEVTEYIPFAIKAKQKMPIREVRKPKYLIIHWTAGEPSQKGEDGISSGVKSGYTYLFLERSGKIYQGAPTNGAGYHSGNGVVSSFDCLGIETACAGSLKKIGDKYAPWYARNEDGSIKSPERCIPESDVIYDADDTKDDGSFKGYYQKFTAEQKASLTKLALYCVQVLGIKVENIRGHDEVATPFGRKNDPGLSIGEGGMVQFRKTIAAHNAAGKHWSSL